MNNLSQPQQETSTSEEAVQYLTFTLGGDAFATEISRVREVLEYTEVTRVPRTSDFMKGVINLRGSVVPVVDLRLQFGMPEGKKTVDSCVVIIEVKLNGKSVVLGALADSVQEVIDLKPEQLEPAPNLGTRINNEFIQYMGKVDKGFIIILDMDRVFTSEQLADVQQSENQSDTENNNMQDIA